MPIRISRRALLKGLAGGALVSVALPPLEAMLDSHGEALSTGAPFPVRFATFFFGNGVLWDRWIPAAQGRDYELTPELAPLGDVREYCRVLTGFDNRIQPKITHHEGVAGMFSGHPFVWGGGLYSQFGGPSVDQVVADRIGGETFLRSVEIGVSKRVSTDEGPTMQFISHRSTDQPIPPEYSPRALFNRMFGSFTPPDDPSGPLRVNVLDAVREDATRLKARVGSADRQRLDAHLESIHTLQEQIAALPPVCQIPDQPSETNTDLQGREPMEEVAAAMTELLVYAWACDITRVASYMLTGGVGHTVYSHLEQNEEQHYMSHAPETYYTQLDQTIIWNVDQFGRLLRRLKETPEGTRNLLDNSVLILGSDCGEGWSHTTFDQPIVVAGGAGGRLAEAGFHYRSPSAENTSDVLLACMQAAAPEVSEVGSQQGYSNTPCPALRVG